jgi:hypothetical protein
MVGAQLPTRQAAGPLRCAQVAIYLHASNGPVSLQQSVTLPDSKCDSPGAARLCFKAMSLGGKGRLAVVRSPLLPPAASAAAPAAALAAAAHLH